MLRLFSRSAVVVIAVILGFLVIQEASFAHRYNAYPSFTTRNGSYYGNYQRHNNHYKRRYNHSNRQRVKSYYCQNNGSYPKYMRRNTGYYYNTGNYGFYYSQPYYSRGGYNSTRYTGNPYFRR